MFNLFKKVYSLTDHESSLNDIEMALYKKALCCQYFKEFKIQTNEKLLELIKVAKKYKLEYKLRYDYHGNKFVQIIYPIQKTDDNILQNKFYENLIKYRNILNYRLFDKYNHNLRPYVINLLNEMVKSDGHMVVNINNINLLDLYNLSDYSGILGYEINISDDKLSIKEILSRGTLDYRSNAVLLMLKINAKIISAIHKNKNFVSINTNNIEQLDVIKDYLIELDIKFKFSYRKVINNVQAHRFKFLNIFFETSF